MQIELDGGARGECVDLRPGVPQTVLAQGVRTPDIVAEGMTPVSTRAMGDAILAELARAGG
jgi:3-isopropylmalate dehydrogenase